MFKNQANENFQRKFEKFKEKWIKEQGSRTSERLIFTEVLVENKTPSIAKLKIESSTGKRGRRSNTINPAGILKKSDALSVRNNSIKRPRGVAKRLFSDQPKVNKLNNISGVSNKTANSELASRPKRKSTSTGNERREKLLKRNVEANSESSSESSILISNSRNCLTSKYARPLRNDIRYDDDLANNKNIPSASVRPYSFHLRSPKLLLNGDEPNISNQSSDSLATAFTENDIEMESSEVTSDVSTSISTRRDGLERRSVVHESPPQISDSLRNDYPSTSNRPNLIYSQIKMQENKILSWLLPPNNISESDTATFSDDGMSSIGCSPICGGTSLASPLIESTNASDVEMPMSDSMMLPMNPRNYTYGLNDTHHYQPNFSFDAVTKYENHCFSPNLESSLPFKKRQMQWCSLLDPLESALTTSMEKLNEIKSDF